MNDVNIKGLTMDSRKVKPNDLFIALKGLTVDGRDFINEAIQKGAVAVLTDEELPNSTLSFQAVPVIKVPNLRDLVGPIAARFFAEPSKHIPVIGITGTSGKTSTAHFIAQILSYCHTRCALMGTLGVGFLEDLTETHCTTLDAISTQAKLSELRNRGATAIAMEVTSHGLVQGRVSGIDFQTAIFTNLTRDHLDYHLDMQQYWQAKKTLFVDFKPKFSIINLEDPYGQQLFQEQSLANPSTAHDQKIIGYTTLSSLPEPIENLIKTKKIDIVRAEKIVLDNAGIRANIKTPWGEGQLRCQLLGHFNLSNLLAAIAAVCIQGISLPETLLAVTELKTVPGRMMHFGGHTGLPLVVVDYSHKPDALTQVLKALRYHCSGKLWCVFGCGGDRDRGKRPLMTAAACTLSDKVIMTQDNPRTEDQNQIFADMTQGLTTSEFESIIVEFDRKKAIDMAIKQASSNDIIVIAGKGHENYQIVGAEKIPFSDQVEVLQALERRTLCVH